MNRCHTSRVFIVAMFDVVNHIARITSVYFCLGKLLNASSAVREEQVATNMQQQHERRIVTNSSMLTNLEYVSSINKRLR